jgi:predicted transcriptional regulator
MAKDAPPPLHELEAEVMDAVWRRGGETTVRDIHGHLNGASPKQRAYTTIMTIMRRLDDKGLLERRREGKTDIYKPTFTLAEYQDARARMQVGALVEEFGDVALTHFAAQMEQLDPERRRKLRRLARRG